jgi:hypothetical protein
MRRIHKGQIIEFVDIFTCLEFLRNITFLNLCLLSSSSKICVRFISSRPELRPTRPPIQRIPGAFIPGVKRPGREADHSPSTSAEVKYLLLAEWRSSIGLRSLSESARFESKGRHFSFQLSFSWFTSVPLGKSRTVSWSGNTRFLPDPFQCIIPEPSYLLMLHNIVVCRTVSMQRAWDARINHTRFWATAR